MTRIVSTLLICLLLSACGGQEATQTPPTNTLEVPPVPQTDATLPMPATIPVGAADFSASGQISFSANPALVDYTFLPDVRRHRMFMRDPGSQYFVLFILPQTPESGIHDLEASGREYEADNVYMAAFTPALADETGIYSKAISGTLTLEVIGEVISGSFNFSAENDNGERVSVSGSFSDIPLVVG